VSTKQKPIEQLVSEIVKAYDKGYWVSAAYRGDIFYSDLWNRLRNEYGKNAGIYHSEACRRLEGSRIKVHS